MVKLKFDEEFFDIKDTLSCGQLFRFNPYLKGYKVFSLNKCAYVYNEDGAVIECEEKDKEYFTEYFDLKRDYSLIYNSAIKENEEIIKISAKSGKGIRILNQDKTESLFSFIISQNNNIPRIKGIIEKLSTSLGEKKSFMGEEYYAFPTVKEMSKKDVEFYSSIGLGYRAPYIKRLADDIEKGLNIEDFSVLKTDELKKKLVSIYGVGPKVADCVSLFGFHRSDSFPVDTWIEKVYKEDFNGKLNDRKKISLYFTERFKDNSGYIQQYLFYYKRSLEKQQEK